MCKINVLNKTTVLKPCVGLQCLKDSENSKNKTNQQDLFSVNPG